MQNTFFKQNLPIILYSIVMLFFLVVKQVTLMGNVFSTDYIVIFVALLIIMHSLAPLINDRNRIIFFIITGLIMILLFVFVISLIMTMIG